MSRKDELRVSDLLSRQLGVEFNRRHYRTDWGEADDSAEIASNCLLILEVERYQNHPHTNVLKLWPLLQREKRLNIILVHAFFPSSRGRTGSRRLLNNWISEAMQKKLTRRFKYCRLDVSEKFRLNKGSGIDELREIICEYQIE